MTIFLAGNGTALSHESFGLGAAAVAARPRRTKVRLGTAPVPVVARKPTGRHRRAGEPSPCACGPASNPPLLSA